VLAAFPAMLLRGEKLKFGLRACLEDPGGLAREALDSDEAPSGTRVKVTGSWGKRAELHHLVHGFEDPCAIRALHALVHLPKDKELLL
jgi:hypothetical protein